MERMVAVIRIISCQCKICKCVQIFFMDSFTVRTQCCLPACIQCLWHYMFKRILSFSNLINNCIICFKIVQILHSFKQKTTIIQRNTIYLPFGEFLFKYGITWKFRISLFTEKNILHQLGISHI